MIWSYCFLLLIIQPVSLQVDYIYIIEINEVKYSDKKPNGFKLEDRMFETYKSLKSYLIKKFFFIPPNKIFLTSDNGVDVIFGIGKRSERLYSSITNPTYNPVNHVPYSINIIEVMFQFGQVIYVCNKSKYGYLNHAQDCINDLYKYGNQRPYNLKLKGDQMIRNIWESNWLGCYYQCFTRDSFSVLKKMLLKELNDLRNKMKLHKLGCFEKLSQYAEKNYNIKNNVNSNSASKLTKCPYKELNEASELQLASTTVNYWYYQFVNFKKNLRNNFNHRQHFRNLRVLFGPTVKQACFGAVKTKESILVTCVFN